MKGFTVYIKRMGQMRIKSILMIVSIAVTLLFLTAISITLFNISASLVNNKIQSIDESMLMNVENNLSTAVSEMTAFAGNLTDDDMLAAALSDAKNYDESLYNLSLARAEIQRLLILAMTFYSEIERIDIYTHYGVFSSAYETISMQYKDIMASALVRKIVQSQNKAAVIEPYFDGVHNNIGKGSMRFGSAIMDEDGFAGVLVVQMRKNWFARLMENDIRVFITGDEGSGIVWENQGPDAVSIHLQELISKLNGNSPIVKLNGENYKITSKDIQSLNWKVSIAHKTDEIFSPLYKIRRYTLLIVLLCVVTMALLLELLISIVTKPLKYLNSMKDSFMTSGELADVQKKFGTKSFREHLMIYFIGIIILPLLLFMALYHYATVSVLTDVSKRLLQLNASQTMNNIEYFYEMTDRISLRLAADVSIQEYMYKTGVEKTEPAIEQFHNFKQHVDKNRAYLDMSYQVQFYDPEGSLIYSSAYDNEPLDTAILQRVQGAYGEYKVWDLLKKDSNNEYYMQYVRKVKQMVPLETRSMSNEIGYISVRFKDKVFSSLYSNLNFPDLTPYVCSMDGVVFSAGDKNMIGKELTIPVEILGRSQRELQMLENNAATDLNTLVLYAVASRIPWIFVEKIPGNEIMHEKSWLGMINITLFLLAATLVLLASYLISNKFNRSIDLLNNRMLNYIKGGGEPEFEKGISINEIAGLATTFSYMAGRIKDLIHEIYDSRIREMELENNRKDSELRALHAQINPHFLYNTLESAKWMVREEQNESAFRMIDHLGEMFRLGAGKEQFLTSVDGEVEYAKAYFQIQKIRFGDRLECKWSIDEDIRRLMVLKFLLQPLIENSIYHGMSDDIATLKIEVFGKPEGENNVVFKVVDNGRGIPDEKRKELIKILSGEAQSKSVGLYNVHNRIRLYFGEDYGLTLNEGGNCGAVIEIRLPRMTNLF